MSLSKPENKREQLWNWLQGYKRGDFRRGKRVQVQLEPIAHIGVFGNLGNGKSAFINTVMKAAQRLDTVPFAAQISGSKVEHGTKNYLEFYIKEGLVSFWDTRGLTYLNEDDSDEVLKFLAGFGSKGFISRKGDKLTEREQELVTRYRKDFQNNNTANPLEGIIICIAADSEENEITSIARVLKTLQIVNFNAVCIVVTKIDKVQGSKEEFLSSFAKRIGAAEHSIFGITNYTKKDEQTNMETEIAALEILRYILEQSESYADFQMSYFQKLRGNIDSAKEKIDKYRLTKEQYLYVIIAILSMLVLYFISSSPSPVHSEKLNKG